MQNCRMLKDIAAVKFAVEICNDFDIKREILCTPGSEYRSLNEKLDVNRKELWTETLEKKTIEKLKTLSLPERIEEKITGLVLVVGTKMVWWTRYHECMFGLSREISVDILNSSVFTSLGIIDSKKAAELLMNEESLSIEQKYRLACIYCFADQLRILFDQIPRERKKNFCSKDDPEQVSQPSLVKFWSNYLMEKKDLLKGEKDLDPNTLEIAVKSGSLPAVEYCLISPNIAKKEHILSNAALAAVRSVLEGYDHSLMKYDSESGGWIPKYYYTNIICFLLSKMEVSEKILFLKKDIEGIHYEDITHREEDVCPHSNVLEYFLDWPYQWFFLDTEKLIREFLPPRSFAYLLLKICIKIENDKEETYYGEEKCFDYRNLLRYFWLKSLECCKKYILHDGFTLEGKHVLSKLFNLKNFTNLDLKNILLILNYASYDERKNIISSDAGKEMCFELMRKEWWSVLDEFVLKCFSCKDEAKKFKKYLIFTDEAKYRFAYFIQNYKVDAIQCFINWTSLSGEELVQYKEEIIFSYQGRKAYMKLVLINGDDESAKKLCKHLLSSERANEFKKTLLSDFDFNYCSNDINGNFQRIENFLQWATSSADEIKKFKYELIYENINFFEDLLFRCSSSWSFDHKVGRLVEKVRGCDLFWISIEKLLTWCLSSEKEILEYKKVLLERFGVKIHFQLIRANQFAEADVFFAWLGLNIRDILKLKRDTIFENIGTILKDLKDTENYSTYDFVDYCFSAYGGLQDRLELLLRWCLCDKESVLEFKSLLEVRYAEHRDFTNILNNFSLAIEEYLIDLEQDHFK